MTLKDNHGSFQGHKTPIRVDFNQSVAMSPPMKHNSKSVASGLEWGSPSIGGRREMSDMKNQCGDCGYPDTHEDVWCDFHESEERSPGCDAESCSASNPETPLADGLPHSAERSQAAPEDMFAKMRKRFAAHPDWSFADLLREVSKIRMKEGSGWDAAILEEAANRITRA